MMYEKEEKRVGRRIDMLSALRMIKRTDKIAVFGACENSKIIIRMLRQRGFSVDKVIDNSSRKVNTYCSEVLVENPEVIKNKEKIYKVLVYSPKYENEIYEQLISYGFKKNKSLFSLLNHLKYITDKFFLKQLTRVYAGLYYYNILKQKYGKDCYMFLCPYTGTGDVYLNCVLMKQYIEDKKIDDYLIIVVSTACKKVTKIFEMEKVEQITKEQSDRIVKANVFAPDICKVHVLNDSWETIYTNFTEGLRGYKGLNFTDMFRYAVFSMSSMPNIVIPDCSLKQNEAKEFFDKSEMVLNKTVILAPYSTTLSELPPELWELTVKKLQKKGYVVYTNSCGENEPVIEGTKGVFFSLDIAIPILNMAGGFIGVRSGFCDIISSCKAKKIIIYEEDDYFFQGTTKEYFSLNDMKLCDDAIELTYCRDINKSVDEICKYFI